MVCGKWNVYIKFIDSDISYVPLHEARQGNSDQRLYADELGVQERCYV